MKRGPAEAFENLRGLAAVASLEKYVMTNGTNQEVRDRATKDFCAAVDQLVAVLEELRDHGAALAECQEFLKATYGGKP